MADLIVAAAQYPIDSFDSFAAYERKLSRWVAGAAARGAKLLVFPEYGAMELASLSPTDVAGDLARSIAAMQELLPRADALHAALARQHDVHISAATFPVAQDDGRYCNTARLFAPSGAVGTQQKLVMTRFERERWNISSGSGQRVFDTVLGPIGIAICYDAEFPLLVRALAQAGAEIILVPSCTDTVAGYNRVRVGSAARALENQCYVVTAPTVGEAPWSPAVDINVGAGAIFGPPDIGFDDDGVLAQGTANAPGWVYGAIELARVAAVRRDGQVLNHAHWADQPGSGVLPPAEIVSLR